MTSAPTRFAAESHTVGDVRVEVVEHLPPSDASTGRWTTHMLAMHRGAPMWCRQRHADTMSEGTFRRGHLTFIPALAEATCWRRAEASYLRVHLSPALGRSYGLDALEVDRRLHRFEDPLLREAALSVLGEARSVGPASRLFVEAASQLIAARVVRLVRGSQPAPRSVGLPEPALRRVLDFIDAELARNPGVAELAQVAGLEPSHFSRMFKRSVGLSPHQYVLRVRLDRAWQLLRTPMRILDVALAVGFANPSQFAAFFRRATGLTPAEGRRRHADDGARFSLDRPENG